MYALEEDPVLDLEDNRAVPKRKVTYELPTDLTYDVAAIARALGQTQDKTVEKMLAPMVKEFLKAATEDQRERYGVARDEVQAKSKGSDDAPAPGKRAAKRAGK